MYRIDLGIVSCLSECNRCTYPISDEQTGRHHVNLEWESECESGTVHLICRVSHQELIKGVAVTSCLHRKR